MELIDFSNRLKDLAFKQRATRDSQHGQTLMKQIMPDFIDVIDEMRGNYEGVKSKPLYISLIADLETPLIAGMVLIACLDNLLEPVSVVSLGTRIGEFLNQELNYRRYSKTDEGKALITRCQRKYENHRSKRAVNDAIENGDIPGLTAVNWTQQARRTIGLVLLKLLEDLGLIEIVQPKRSNCYQWAEHVQQWCIDTFDLCTYWTPNYTPLLTPPQEWVQGKPNLSYGEHYPPVQFRLKSKASERRGSNGNNMVAADKLGAVPYTMNKDVLNIALELWQQGYEVGQLVSSKAMEFNPYPVDGKPEVVLEWNRHATKVYTYNQQTHGRRLYYTRTMAIIKAYSELPEFYFLWVADSRGRLYPQTSTLLSPQGHDFGKALLLFKNKKPLEDRGLYHLHCAVAEHYGVDKVSIEDRYQWTKDNLGMVLEVGTTHTTGLWENADSPWQYLAACIELTNALSLDDPATYECGLAKFMDGKCSGAQHWAAMLKDEDTGKSVGLTPSSVEGDPPDLYSEVLQTWVEGLLRGRWADDRGYDTWAKELVLSGAMSRVWAKSPVMTYLYGSKIITWSRHITQCLRDSIDTTDIDDLGKRSYWLASCLSDVMEDRLSSIVVGMGWITSCIRILNCVTDDIKFISSSGFEINMRYRKSVSKQKKIVCLIFKTPIKYSLNEDTEELNRCKQSGAAAPNFIHSQDAAHLSNSVIASADQGLDIQVIHDCFGTHMCDVDSMTTMVKQQFIDMYESDMLTELRDYWVSVYGVELPELPRYGDLDLTQMKDSVYAFSG